MRAGGMIAEMEAGAGADIGYEPQDDEYARFGFDEDDPTASGSSGRRALFVWGASAIWLLFVWRAVEGF